MPITIDNGLPAVALRFGSTDDDEVNFKVSIDSCAGLNIGNLRLHQWVATTFPHIVQEWIEFDDKEKFEPLSLNCAVEDIKTVENNAGKLTAMVTYFTRYTDSCSRPVTISFGLGRDVAVNAIVGKPTLKSWKGCIDFASDTFTSEELKLTFSMDYKMADTGLPPDVVFDSTSFIRPKKTPVNSAGVMVVSIDRKSNSATTLPKLDTPVVTESQINGCLQRCVTHPAVL